MSSRRSTATTVQHQADSANTSVRDILTEQELKLIELWRSTHPLRHCLSVVLGIVAYPLYFFGVLLLCMLALIFFNKIFAYSFGLFDENIKPRDV